MELACHEVKLLKPEQNPVLCEVVFLGHFVTGMNSDHIYASHQNWELSKRGSAILEVFQGASRLKSVSLRIGLLDIYR